MDDDVSIREVLRMLLQDAGYAVFEAPDGMPALRHLRAHPHGMVALPDLNMRCTAGGGRESGGECHQIAW